MPIIGGLTVPIAQHFLVHPNNSTKELRKIVSHPHAIAQCHDFLQKQYPNAEWEYMNSTGQLQQFVKEHPDLSIAAIANELAAEEYGL